MKSGGVFRDVSQLQTPGLIGRFLLVLVAIAVAVPLTGYWIGTGQMQWLIFVLVATAATFVVGGLRRRAWFLIPFAWSFAGQSGLIPLPLTVRDMSVLLVFGAWLINVAFSRERLKTRWHVLEFLLLINFLWLAVTYYMNPVGLRATSSEIYGGRHYWNFMIAGIAYWVIVRMPENPRQASWFPHFWLGGLLFIGAINILVYLMPGLTPIVYAIYSGVALDMLASEGPFLRLAGMGSVGLGIAQYLCAYFPPITLLNPMRIRCYIFLIGIAGILISGFRSAAIVLVPIFFFGSWFRRRALDLVGVGVVGIAMLTLIILGHGRLYSLPAGVQRTLSSFPGKWDQQVLDNAQGSTEWRFQLWRDIVRYRMINNWWLGDGFGFRQDDFELGRGALIERGSFHSGPLTAVRYVGIVGLVLFYGLMIGGAVYSVRCVNSCRGTPLFPPAILAATVLIWDPIHYTLIFGSYPLQLANTIFFIAVVRLMLEMRDRLLPAGSTPELPQKSASPAPVVPHKTNAAMTV